jgi:hypothetical protein
MFCCEESSATVIAGSHNNTSSTATSADCSPQITPARHPRNFGEAVAIRDRINHPNPAAANTISTGNNHPGHVPNRTNRPFENTAYGYLKKNRNMLG